VSKVIQTTDLPKPGSPQETVLVRAEMFFSSRGHFGRPPGTTISVDERLAQVGWQAVAHTTRQPIRFFHKRRSSERLERIGQPNAAPRGAISKPCNSLPLHDRCGIAEVSQFHRI
jgi:hypothetical protein